MNTWITSDQHFGHYVSEGQNIIKYCNRPFKNIEEMDQKLQQYWNELVAEEDTVYVLGDYIFKYPENFHLNGKIILIRGNHDHVTEKKLREKYCVDTVYKRPIKISYNGHEIKLMHSPNHKEGGCINFCGHMHNLWVYEDGVYNVGVDNHGFRPILLDEAMNRYFWHINYKESTTEDEAIY